MGSFINLNKLTLKIARDEKSADYPVLAADFSYTVGAFPVVSAVVSTAAEFLSYSTDRSSAKDILKDSPTGAVGSIILHMDVDDENQDCVLFCGYVATITPALQTNIVSVNSTLTVQLICATGAVNGLPGNALRYYNLGGTDGGSVQPLTYADLLSTLVAAVSGDAFEMGMLFQQSPAKCVVTLLDKLRGATGQENTMTKLADTVIFGEGPLGVVIPQPSSIPQTFLDQMSRALPSAPAASVMVAALQQLYLSMVPETMAADDHTPCRMIIKPINAWDSKSHFDLSLNDIIGVQEHTAYKLDQHIDFWVVQFPPLANDPHPGRLAVYGPGVGAGGGKAHVYTEAEFQAALGKENDKGQFNNYAARMIMLPGWLNVLEGKTETVDAALKRNVPNWVSLLPKPDQMLTTLIDIAERVAVTGYLQEGCAASAAGLRLPFATYLRLLPHLGTMISFEVPEAYSNQVMDVDRIPTSKRYGLLANLSMKISVERKELHVACGAQISNVHDEEMQRTYGAPHPLYPGTNVSGANSGAQITNQLAMVDKAYQQYQTLVDAIANVAIGDDEDFGGDV